MLLVKVHDREALIVGYGPGEAGSPRAIVLMDGALSAVPLSDVEVIMKQIPKRLRRKLRKKPELTLISASGAVDAR